jgi:gliding motility-associated-like protein
MGTFETYQWSNNNGQEASIQVNEANTFEVTVSDINGCETNASVTTSIFTVVAPQITGETEYCEGASTILDGGVGYTSYSWSNSEDTQEVEVTAPGEYILSVIDANGCSAEASIDITENPLPQVSISGSSSYCVGGSTTLDAGDGFTSYQWSDNSQDQTIVVNTPGQVSVLVTDANGCQNTATLDVEEDTELSIDITGDLGICPGESTELSVGNFATYQWSDNSDAPTLTTDQAGIYTVTVTDADGCLGSGEVEVIGFDAPTPQILGDLDFCEDEMTTLSLNETYEMYTWSTNESSPVIETNTAGNYSVEVTDMNGCTAITSVDVEVYALPVFEIVGSNQYCEGESTELSVNGTFATYDWSNGDMTVNTTADQPGLYEVVVASDEGCESTSSIQVNEIPLPQADAGDIQLIDCENTSVIIGGPNTPQGNYAYTWAGPGIDPSNQNDYQPTVDSGGIYTLIVEDLDNGCISEPAEVEVEDLRYEPVVVLEVLDVLDCETSSVLIDSDGTTFGSNIAYQWQDASGTIMSNDQNYVATQPGIVVLMIIDEVTGCMALDSVTIEQNEDYPIVIAGDDQELDCDTPDATLDGSASQSSLNIIYEWTAQAGGNIISDNTQPIITVDAVGTYTLVAVDTTNGCTNEDIVEVLGDFEPPIAEAGMSQTLDCNNLSVLLEGNGSSIGTNISYEWQNASGETVGEDISFNADMIGVYQLIVTDNQNGCTAEDNVEVFEVEDELSAYDLSWDGPTCFGDDDASLSIFNIEGGDGPYLYSINDGAFSSNPDFTGLMAGTYAVVVQDANGCEVFSEVVIEDGNDLQVNLGEDININLGEVVTVDGNVTVDRGDLAEIIWKVTGDTLGCDDCIVFDASPMLTSEYILTVVDSNGCVATDDLTIFVDATDDIFIPNAFSPDGDGNNERFTIYTGDDVAKVRSFLVFNRWGEVMHEVYNFPSNDEDFGWNGEYRGQLQNTGIFVYMAEIEFIDGTVKLYKGDVLLMK